MNPDHVKAIREQVRGYVAGLLCRAKVKSITCERGYLVAIDYEPLCIYESPRAVLDYAMANAGWRFDLDKPICPACWRRYEWQRDIAERDDLWKWMDVADDNRVRLARLSIRDLTQGGKR